MLRQRIETYCPIFRAIFRVYKKQKQQLQTSTWKFARTREQSIEKLITNGNKVIEKTINLYVLWAAHYVTILERHTWKTRYQKKNQLTIMTDD